MRQLKHLQGDNEVVLWKSANVDIGNGNNMIVLYYYHSNPNNKSDNFYKCSIRIDKKSNWMKIRENLLKENPAALFENSMIGLDDSFNVYYGKHTFTKADMYKWIGMKFLDTKIQDIDTFLGNEFENKKEPYLRKYTINGKEVDISETSKIPHGKWFSTFKEKKTHKNYGKVIH